MRDSPKSASKEDWLSEIKMVNLLDVSEDMDVFCVTYTFEIGVNDSSGMQIGKPRSNG